MAAAAKQQTSEERREFYMDGLRRLATLVKTHEQELFLLAYDFEQSETWMVSNETFDVQLSKLIGKKLTNRYRTGFVRLVEEHGLSRVKKLGYHTLIDALPVERKPRGVSRFTLAKAALIRIARAEESVGRSDLVRIARHALKEIEVVESKTPREREI